jgi:PKD repeat protein
VSFTDKSYDPDGSIVYWHWDFGDGKTFDYAHPGSITYVYTSPGTYTVTLTVRDDKGAENSTSRIIQVKAQQAVSTPTETSTLVAIVLVVVAAIVALYLILKRRTPKPPPPPLLPPPPPPG